MTQELLPHVLAVVAQVMNVPVESLDSQSSPDTVEPWDSLKHMNLVLALESAFNVQFTGEDIVEMLSVELIVEIVGQHRV